MDNKVIKIDLNVKEEKKDKIFKTNLNDSNQSIELEKKITYPIHIPVDEYSYIMKIVSFNFQNGNRDYKIKDAFLEGLNILKEEFPNIDDTNSYGKRIYRGGDQKKKPEYVRTSIVLLKKDINWIDSYIINQGNNDIFYTKISFLIDLVKRLKQKYTDGKGL